MIDLFTLIWNGFEPLEWGFIAIASIVAALIMNRWGQITAAALLTYTIDVMVRFIATIYTNEGVPLDMTMNIALARMDEHGLAATLRPFLYFGAISLAYWTKRRYGAK